MASNEAKTKADPARGTARGAAAPATTRTAPAARPAPKRVGLLEFFAQVRDEGRKVTWPTRKETMVTTVMVFIMVIVAAVFFTAVDQTLRWLVGLILGIGR